MVQWAKGREIGKRVEIKRDWADPKNREKFVTRGELLFWLNQHERWVKERDPLRRIGRWLGAPWRWLVGLMSPLWRRMPEPDPIQAVADSIEPPEGAAQ